MGLIPLAQLGEELGDHALADLVRGCDRRSAQEFLPAPQITPIGSQGVARKAPLDVQVAQPRQDGPVDRSRPGRRELRLAQASTVSGSV